MLVLGQINDPRLHDVFITDVNVDRELSIANIYISAIDKENSPEMLLAGFEHASGFLRTTLSKRIELRTFPKLRFFWDETPERAERIERLIDELIYKNKENTAKNEKPRNS